MVNNGKKNIVWKLRLAGILGTLGMLLGAAADLASGYSTTGTAVIETPFSVLSLTNLESFLASKPHGEILLGHYMAIVGIPLGIFGLWQVYRAIEPAGVWLSRIVWIVGVFTYVVGTVFHASYAYLTTTFRTLEEVGPSAERPIRAMLANYVDFFEPLAAILIVSMTVCLGLIFYAVLFESTHYPRWFAGFNPLVIQLVTGVVAALVPVGLKMFLIVTTYNLSLAIFYLVSTVLLWDVEFMDGSAGETV